MLSNTVYWSKKVCIVCVNFINYYFLAFSCNFDTSMCGFVQDSNDTFDWTRHRGSTSSMYTGPSADHTTGNGMNRDLPWLYLPPLLHLKIGRNLIYCYGGILCPRRGSSNKCNEVKTTFLTKATWFCFHKYTNRRMLFILIRVFKSFMIDSTFINTIIYVSWYKGWHASTTKWKNKINLSNESTYIAMTTHLDRIYMSNVTTAQQNNLKG